MRVMKSVDEVSHYMERFGGLGARLVGIAIQILLYIDDIVLISDSLEELQRHLNALKLFCIDKGLSINMNKTKVTSMGNKIRTKILLGRGKGGIHTLLHIPRSNIYRT